MRPTAYLFLSSLTLFWLCSCSSYDERLTSRETEYLMGPGQPPAQLPSGGSSSGYDPISYWDGDGVSGAPSVRIEIGQQRAYFYKGGELVGLAQISSGREGYNTPNGTYKIIQKDKDHASNLYGDFVDANGAIMMANVSVKDKKPPGSVFKGAPMPYFMRIVDGVGMHAGFLPGYPASHGCIRMPEHMAEVFFANLEKGTPVTIHQ